MLVFNMLYPARAAGGEHGKLCTGLELIEELRRFLHDGKVGGERRVEHIVDTHHLERSDYLAHHGDICGDAELLSDSDTDCRSDLNCDLLAGVVDGLPHGRHFIFDGDCAGGAD